MASKIRLGKERWAINNLITLTAASLCLEYRSYRTKAQEHGAQYEPPTKTTLYSLWAEAHLVKPEMVFAAWYKVATDHQVTRTLNLAIKRLKDV